MDEAVVNAPALSTVALANKLARIGWAVLREHTVYRAA